MRRAWLRKVRYWVSYVLRYRSALVVYPLLYWVIGRIGSRTWFEGIEVLAPPVSKGEDEPPFLRDTIAALRLIQAVDPSRFRRVQREIATIEDDPRLSSHPTDG